MSRLIRFAAAAPLRRYAASPSLAPSPSPSPSPSSSPLPLPIPRDRIRPADGPAAHVRLSDRAVAHLRVLQTRRAELLGLRVMITAGGCSGFQYVFRPETRVNADDQVFERDGVRVILDDYTAEKMGGATVDFTQELIKQAFVVVGNPNAQSGCGCGVSFDLKQT